MCAQHVLSYHLMYHEEMVFGTGSRKKSSFLSGTTTNALDLSGHRNIGSLLLELYFTNVWGNLCFLIWSRPLIKSRTVTNRIFYCLKRPSFFVLTQHVLR